MTKGAYCPLPKVMGDEGPVVQLPAVIDTPDGISFVRLLSLRGMLRMEKAGMKTRGGALRPRIAAEFGLKPRDSYDVFIAKFDAMIEAAKAKRAEELA